MTDTVFLVVDDDGMVREILKQYLETFGFKNILEARDGEAALKIVRNKKQRIDVVISDWEMPKVNGLALLRAVKRDPNRAGVKFVIVSSQVSRERTKISKAAEAEVDAYLVKPFRANALKEKIEALLKPTNESPKAVVLETKVQAEGDEESAEDGKSPYIKEKNKVVDATVVVKLANSYLRVKWYDKAITVCQNTARKVKDNPDLFFVMSKAFFLKGQYNEALMNLNRVLELKPDHAEAKKLAGELALMTSKKMDEAG